MSETRISVHAAAVQTSKRLGVDVPTARNMLLAAAAEGKLRLTIDEECERQFRNQVEESKRRSPRPQLSLEWSESALAALAELGESATQSAIAGALPALCGMVEQAELSAWLNFLSPPQLTKATTAQIRDTVRGVYTDPAYSLPHNKPPNLVELVPIVQHRLAVQGLKASGRPIQTIGDEAEFKAFRLPIGKRLH